jgi:hypothetical protein
MVLRSAFALLLVALTACQTATTSGVVPPLTLASIKTLGVVSAIGNRFTFQTLGYTRFGNDKKPIPSADWGIDRLAVEQAAALLGKRYELRPAEVPPGSLSRDNVHTLARREVVNGRHPLGDVLRDALAGKAADLWLVVLPSASPLSNTDQLMEGIGMIWWGGALTERWDVYTIYSVAILDGHSFELIAEASPEPFEREFFATIRGPHRRVDKVLWAEQPANITPAQRQRLADIVKELVGQSLPPTLRKLKLID